MIYRNTKDFLERLEYIDRIIDYYPIEQLRAMAESDIIVEKLKGNYINEPGYLTRMLDRENQLTMSVDLLKSEIEMLKQDIRGIVTQINDQSKISNYQFMNVKQKYGIY